MENLEAFFQKSELIPAIVQDYRTKEVLMLAYMSRESLAKTLETGMTWFYSRSRKELWNKGATSGNFQKVMKIDYDCDMDTLLVFVEQTGSCFYRTLKESESELPEINPLYSLEKVVEDRRINPEEGSYTCYLFEKGLDKVLKKVGEECAETIIAAKNGVKEDLTGEISDLVYHLIVMMNCCQLPLKDVMDELEKRSHKIGNLKKMKTVDRNT